MKNKLPHFKVSYLVINLTILAFLFNKSFVYSQLSDIESSNISSIDAQYIKSHTNKLGIYIFTSRKYRTYGFKNNENDVKLRFEPNGQTNLGLGFNYKWLNLGVAASFDFMNKDNNVYGNTDRLDGQINAFGRKVGLSAHYQNYKGFHLSNSQDFFDSDTILFPYFSDMQSVSYGISFFYFSNNQRFSYKAAYIRNEVQLKSAGGFVLGAYFDLDHLKREDGFVPPQLPDSLKQYFQLKGFTTHVAGLSFGYAYTLVFLKHFFINLSCVPGIGLRSLSVDYFDKQRSAEPGFTGSLSLRSTLAYEGKHFYCGFTSHSGFESFKYESIDISTNRGQIRFYAGKRFKLNNK
ncbi:MAG: DUF4421 family protein [Bacteroidales bacterium]